MVLVMSQRRLSALATGSCGPSSSSKASHSRGGSRLPREQSEADRPRPGVSTMPLLPHSTD